VTAPIRRTARIVAVIAFVVLVGGGCRVQIATSVDVDYSGRGTVTQGIGFDDAALKRVGDLDQALSADDFRAAGWVVDAASKEGDLTWVRIHHDFSTPAEGTALLAQLSGPDGPYRDLLVAKSDGLLSRGIKVTGQIDTTAGLAMFGDEQLAAALGGDASGGLLAKIQAEEGRPPAEMVGLSFTVGLPGKLATYDASFSDTSMQEVKVSSSQGKLLRLLETIVVVVLVTLTAAVLGLRWRARRIRTRRLMRSRGRRW
jgi:hypothetical protein